MAWYVGVGCNNIHCSEHMYDAMQLTWLGMLGWGGWVGVGCNNIHCIEHMYDATQLTWLGMFVFKILDMIDFLIKYNLFDKNEKIRFSEGFDKQICIYKPYLQWSALQIAMFHLQNKVEHMRGH